MPGVVAKVLLDSPDVVFISGMRPGEIDEVVTLDRDDSGTARRGGVDVGIPLLTVQSDRVVTPAAQLDAGAPGVQFPLTIRFSNAPGVPISSTIAQMMAARFFISFPFLFACVM